MELIEGDRDRNGRPEDLCVVCGSSPVRNTKHGFSMGGRNALWLIAATVVLAAVQKRWRLSSN